MTGFDRQTSEGFLVNFAARAFARALARRVAPLGGVPAEFPVFLALDADGELSQAELVRRAGIEQGSMAQLLQRMERDGLVRRRQDPADKRRALYALPPKAKRLLAAMVEQAVAVNALATRGLDAGDRRELHRLLRHVTENLARAEDAP